MSDFNLKLTQAFGESLGGYFLTAYRLLQSNFPSKELDDWWLQIEFDITNSFVKQGQANHWEKQISKLPSLTESHVVGGEVVSTKSSNILSQANTKLMYEVLQSLKPWRKGPYDFFGIQVNSEWRSDMKWARICQYLELTPNAKVLDVGCGNGYYMWRMLDHGASMVLGIDPSFLCVAQFRAIKQYAANAPLAILPIGTESLKREMRWFDIVFSMGVLYHRRNPMEHLVELRNMLKPGGQLVLETLIIENDLEETLIPESRYAQMRNVWGISSPPQIQAWLGKAGFKNVSCVDITKTTIEEQRATHWINSFSLENFLDSEDYTRTVEGYPAPVRACFVAEL